MTRTLKAGHGLIIAFKPARLRKIRSEMKKRVYFDALKWHNIYKCAMRNNEGRALRGGKICNKL